jgi:hypothetical protein
MCKFPNQCDCDGCNPDISFITKAEFFVGGRRPVFLGKPVPQSDPTENILTNSHFGRLSLLLLINKFNFYYYLIYLVLSFIVDYFPKNPWHRNLVFPLSAGAPVFIYGLLNDAASNSEYIASNGRSIVNNELERI